MWKGLKKGRGSSGGAETGGDSSIQRYKDPSIQILHKTGRKIIAPDRQPSEMVSARVLLLIFEAARIVSIIKVHDASVLTIFKTLILHAYL